MGNLDLNWFSILSRLGLALVLVLATYNPDEYSYYHWGIQHIQVDMPAKVFVGLVLFIAWAKFIRNTGDRFGYMGAFLTVSFFGTLGWLVVDQAWLSDLHEKIFIYVILFSVSWIITTGFTLPFLHTKFER